MSVNHYENFPVASWLCPAKLRPAVKAIYWFARTADDLADEGQATPEQRLADLESYRQSLQQCITSTEVYGPWARIFQALGAAIREHQLPVQPFFDLLRAFSQDASNPIYPDRTALLDYCSRSANPIGRLMLALNGLQGEKLQAQSDAICTALQLINFWQDLSIDLPRGRHYVTLADLNYHDLTHADLAHQRDTAATRALVADLCHWARGLMLEGAPLARAMPGRMGWELRVVVQGGLRILDKIKAMQYGTLRQRPRLTALDAPVLLWRSFGPTAKQGRP